MLVIPLIAQLLAAEPSAARDPLPALLERAAAARRLARASDEAWRARAESEIAIVQRLGDEASIVHLEQVGVDVRWRPPDVAEHRVVAWRAGTTTPAVSALSILRRPWVMATPGGGALRMPLHGPGLPGLRDREHRGAHPLDADRDSSYVFHGGDAIDLVLPGGDSILVRRVRVSPRAEAPADVQLVFRGEMDIEPASGALVRLRGHLLLRAREESSWRRLLARGVRSVAVAELVNERAASGRWLPAFQRVELQIASPLIEGAGAVLRVTTRLHSHRPDEDHAPPCASAPGGAGAGDADAAGEDAHHASADPSSAAGGECLEIAIADRGTDSVETRWVAALGVMTAAGAADDFDDVTSGDWNRPTPISDAAAGASAGEGDSARRRWLARAERWRDRLTIPDVHAGAAVRRRWTDDALLGALGIGWRRGAWSASLGVERELLAGGGLLPMPGDEAGTLALRIGTVASPDDSTTFTARHEIGGPSGARLRLDAARADDRAHSHALAVAMPCRRALDAAPRAHVGRNLRLHAVLDLGATGPRVRDEVGIGAGLRFRRVDCEASRRHVEARLLARGANGPASWTLRLDGATASTTPLSGAEPWSGSVNRDPSIATPTRFEHHRAARLRLSAAWRVPRFAAPLRSLLWLRVPGGMPSAGIALETSWHDMRARTAADVSIHRSALASRLELVVRPLGGHLGIGVGRTLVGATGWRLVLTADPEW